MTAYVNSKPGKRPNQFFGERLFDKPLKKRVLIGKVRGLVESTSGRVKKASK